MSTIRGVIERTGGKIDDKEEGVQVVNSAATFLQNMCSAHSDAILTFFFSPRDLSESLAFYHFLLFPLVNLFANTLFILITIARIRRFLLIRIQLFYGKPCDRDAVTVGMKVTFVKLHVAHFTRKK